MHAPVIGAGIAGLSSAWALAKTGHAVTPLEQADGYARTITETFDAWDELWRDLGRTHYTPCGVPAISQRPGDEAEVPRVGLDRNEDPARS